MVFYVNPRTVTISWIEPAYSFFWFDVPAVHGTSMYPVGSLNYGPTSMSKAPNASRGIQFVGLDVVSCRNSEKFVLKQSRQRHISCVSVYLVMCSRKTLCRSSWKQGNELTQARTMEMQVTRIASIRSELPTTPTRSPTAWHAALDRSIPGMSSILTPH